MTRLHKWWWGVLACIICTASQADDLLIVKLSSGQNVAVRTGDGAFEIIGVFDNMTVIGSDPTPTPDDEPTGPGQLICVRPWSCTLDESDADLTIRESIDAAKSTVPYFRLLPGTLDQRMQTHQAEAYRKLVKDTTKAWIFHVVPTKTTPRILHQGPLDADVALGWVKVPRLQLAADEQPNVEKWLDIDFSKEQPELLGSIELPPALRAEAIAAATNISTLPGFKPIPRSEWAAWCERFPVSRLAQSVRNITEQTMGSCVGHSCANIVEAGCYFQSGDQFFRRLSGMCIYVRIGDRPNSGAFIGDAADEIFSRGTLPVTGQGYPHEFPQDTDFYRKLPSGWETTAAGWKAAVYSVTDEESAFRARMDARIFDQFGRSNHALRGMCVWIDGRGRILWPYENSWGAGWGDFGKGIGYDSKFYSGYVYAPVLRDEVPILMARELPAFRPLVSDALGEAADEFHRRIQEIKLRAASKETNSGCDNGTCPAPQSPASTTRSTSQPQRRSGLFRRR